MHNICHSTVSPFSSLCVFVICCVWFLATYSHDPSPPPILLPHQPQYKNVAFSFSYGQIVSPLQWYSRPFTAPCFCELIQVLFASHASSNFYLLLSLLYILTAQPADSSLVTDPPKPSLLLPHATAVPALNPHRYHSALHLPSLCHSSPVSSWTSAPISVLFHD